MDDMAKRFERIRPELVDRDGRRWWPLRTVCDALRCSNYRTASMLIPAGNKRRWIKHARDWRRKQAICLIDREGVERLVIRYSNAPRWAVMAALDAAGE
jgi:hypothetical protein